MMNSTAEPVGFDTTVAPGLGERLLIVEDEIATRVGLTELVRNWGFLAESAADAEEALTKVTSFRPAIIITDLEMPGLSGLDLLRTLQ